MNVEWGKEDESARRLKQGRGVADVANLRSLMDFDWLSGALMTASQRGLSFECAV